MQQISTVTEILKTEKNEKLQGDSPSYRSRPYTITSGLAIPIRTFTLSSESLFHNMAENEIKLQCQTFKSLGIDFGSECFARGQYDTRAYHANWKTG